MPVWNQESFRTHSATETLQDMSLDTLFFKNSLLSWLVAHGTSVVVFAALLLLRRVIVRRALAMSAKTAMKWDDTLAELLRQTSAPFLFVFALTCGARLLSLPDRMSVALNTIVIVVLLIQVGIWLTAAARDILERYRADKLPNDRSTATMIGAISFVVQLVIWSAVLLLVLDNMGFDITALVASLGVGGVAVALATQNILGDLFSSLAIVLDKPFVLGDFIIVDDLLGSVENIGLKTTRLRALSGEQLIFSNADLIGSRVRNFGRMYERRVLFPIGVTYQTPRRDLERIPDMLRAAIESQDDVRFDRAHFASYGDFSINFETVYYVLSPEYNRYMDIHQAVNLSIHEQFEDATIEFAYPTQTLVLTRGVASTRELETTPA